MSTIQNIVCVVCPVGCQLEVQLNEGTVAQVTGHSCKRGLEYAVNECTNPVRTVTSTVKVEGSDLPVVPVKTEKPIPKHLVFDCMRAINQCMLHAPVNVGDIIIENLLNTGVNVVASGKAPKKITNES